jgi:hypothetical protein
MNTNQHSTYSDQSRVLNLSIRKNRRGSRHFPKSRTFQVVITKTAPTFEIMMAAVGPVSAGNSTLIKALLVGNYSEVSIRRTTAGVNVFRLTPPERSEDGIPSDTKWSMFPDKVTALNPKPFFRAPLLCWIPWPTLKEMYIRGILFV